MKKKEDELFDREAAQGSAFDKIHFTDDELRQGTDINKMAEAGQISWDDAHNWWENTRAGYGYSGGANGHGYTKLGGTKDNAPTYTNRYQGAMDLAMATLMGRKPFSYDPAKDPNYQQYAETYTRMGQQAMDDTLAQVSARTGGLASSYAGSAAQQTYNEHMSALADKVPQLRQMAYEMYLGEEDAARKNMSMLQGLENADYGRYLDRLGQWNADRQFEYGKAQDAQDQQNYLDDVAYRKERDGLADQQKAQEKDEAKQMALAELMADAGDFSSLKGILGLTDEQVARLEANYRAKNTPKVTGRDGGTSDWWSDFKKTPYYTPIMEKTKTITNQDDLSAYYQDLVDKGILTNEQAIELFNAYMPEAESPTTDELWEVVDNGGWNWGLGIDNNAKVQDRSGNTYTLKELKEKMINDGMTEKEATEYVKKLQKELGI